jgi:hypothetical protein
VGESGQNSLDGPSDAAAAISSFEKKFKDKTGYAWSGNQGARVCGCVCVDAWCVDTWCVGVGGGGFLWARSALRCFSFATLLRFFWEQGSYPGGKKGKYSVIFENYEGSNQAAKLASSGPAAGGAAAAAQPTNYLPPKISGELADFVALVTDSDMVSFAKRQGNRHFWPSNVI